jgi:outer membrane receptor protein involved in Fe transport
MSLIKYLFLLLFFAIGALSAQAQIEKYVFKGLVIDAQDGEPVPYATVVLHSIATNNIIAGTTTKDDGRFMLTSDSIDVYLEFSFIGYEKKEVRDFEIENRIVRLGRIKLGQNAQTLNEVNITAEKSSVEFRLDKRVFNVGKDISSTGMGALEVLNNVPSVNVDIEGTVSLRGNTGVQILINGKPSVLADEQSNALGSISADMIESVEVITNPSAKYEAAGTSGIINIILKKEEKKGLNGSVSVNTGWPHNHSVGGSVNYRREKLNFFSQFGAGYRSLPRYRTTENHNLITNTKVLGDGVNYRNENFYNITLGTDYYINDYNTLTLSGSFAYEIESQPSENKISFIDSLGNLTSEYNRIEETEALNPKYQYDLQYKKQFKNNKDHVLLFSTLGSFFGKSQSSEFTNNYLEGIKLDADQQTATDFYQANYTFKLDYTNPITKTMTIEVGSLYEINDVGNDYEVSSFIDNTWEIDSSLTNNFEFDQMVLGVYATGSYEGEKWGIKAGLRVENTDLTTVLTTTNQTDNQNYTNLFPSLHTSYKVSKRISLQAGYSKRIFRPRLWDLNPFFNIQNNYNIRTGNPNLLPQFADSYEITAILIFDKLSMNTSIYNLYTTDVKETISTFENNINITKPINVGTNNKTGFELNGKYTPKKWMTITGDFNYGYFIRRGTYEDQNFDFSGGQWSSRLTAKFKMKAGIDVELIPRYQSGFQTVQGSVSGYPSLDTGLRKKIWKGKAVVNASVRDVFASRIRESFVEQANFNIYSFSQRGRFITLGFSYSFGKGEAMSYSGGRRR